MIVPVSDREADVLSRWQHFFRCTHAACCLHICAIDTVQLLFQLKIQRITVCFQMREKRRENSCQNLILIHGQFTHNKYNCKIEVFLFILHCLFVSLIFIFSYAFFSRLARELLRVIFDLIITI